MDIKGSWWPVIPSVMPAKKKKNMVTHNQRVLGTNVLQISKMRSVIDNMYACGVHGNILKYAVLKQRITYNPFRGGIVGFKNGSGNGI
jgi:hypothetical protein